MATKNGEKTRTAKSHTLHQEKQNMLFFTDMAFHFRIKFPSKFHVFSGTHPGPHFSYFSNILCKNHDFWTPPGPSWRPKGLPNPHNFCKKYEKSSQGCSRLAFLGPRGAPDTARVAPRPHFVKTDVHFRHTLPKTSTKTPTKTPTKRPA